MTGFYRGRRTTNSAVAAILLASFAFALQPSPALRCPPGYSPADSALRRFAGIAPAASAPSVCVNDNHPEGYNELDGLAQQRAAIRTAPYDTIPAGAINAALDDKRALWDVGQDAQNSHEWKPVGRGPLESADAGYTGVNTLGLVDLAGRITSFAYSPPGDKHFPDKIFASVAYGGVWIADSDVKRWRSIGDRLPTQIVGAVGYTPAAGGTIIAVTGDGSFGRYSREGGGAFYTRDGGQHWTHARGIPDDAFGFKVAVDKVHPRIVYVATGAGLFRSNDAGRNYKNVALPTGSCAGKSNRTKGCIFSNEVTDVVVMEPGGVTDEAGGKVIASVGWRFGNKTNPNGTVQSPNNGIYTSDTGLPGSFEKSAATGFVPQDRIGRVEMGAATGPTQDHNIIYALVQDAILARNGLPGIDVPGVDYNKTCLSAKKSLSNLGVPAIPYDLPPCQPPTVLNGVYVSLDWGQTWVKMADAAQLLIPGTGSALTPGEAALGYAPGVQSWYNAWIKPDPTLADPIYGAPTRLLFGLEEVWSSFNQNIPAIGPIPFKVIGRYFAGDTCIAILQAGLPACPTNGTEALLKETTTHPDQHDAIFIPQKDGGVRLVVGNDGGVYTQVVKAGKHFNNNSWGEGSNLGFNTLFPYDAVRASDGTVWMGLQDNGTAKIVDIKDDKGRIVQRGRQIMAKGGDGFFVAVDPNNGKVAYGEYVGGAMSATTDGGLTWSEMSPPITDGQFSTPFVMDPLDPGHLMVAGRQVVETGSGAGTSADDWATVFDLGTLQHPGDTDAEPTDTDPVNQMTAIDLVGPAAYVGFCGPCAVLNVNAPFRSGIATNVGGSARPERYSTKGWHIAKAIGLPNRYITTVAIDPKDPKTVYAAAGGYINRWTPPGQIDAATREIAGHIFVSHDAGEHFTDISGNLPNTPVNWITLRGDQIIAATDIGVFVSEEGKACEKACSFQILGQGLPASPVFTTRLSHGDPNLLIAAAYGRGVWSYRFGPTPPAPEAKGVKLPTPKFLNKLVAQFDWDTDAQGWITKTNSDTMAWRLQPPGSNSPQAFQVVPYTDESSASLISPKMALPARSLIKMQWDERRDTELCCDFLTLDWSSDGYVWHTVRAIDGQNPDYPLYTTVSTQFVAPAGGLFLRFRLTSDQLVSSPAYLGVALDNVMVSR